MRSFESVESMMGRLVEMRMLGIETTQPKLEKMIRQRLEPSWSTPKPPTFNELLSRVEQWKRVDRACRPPPRDARRPAQRRVRAAVLRLSIHRLQRLGA